MNGFLRLTPKIPFHESNITLSRITDWDGLYGNSKWGDNDVRLEMVGGYSKAVKDTMGQKLGEGST